MYATYIHEIVEALKKGNPGIDPKLAYDALARYWSDYAVSIFDVEDVCDAARANGVPMSQFEAREILYQAEEGQGSGLTKEGLEVAVQDWVDEFVWLKPEDPIDPAEFSLQTCDWAILAGSSHNKLTGWSDGKSVRLVDSSKSLESAIEVALSRVAVDPQLDYCIYAVDEGWDSYGAERIESNGTLVWQQHAKNNG